MTNPTLERAARAVGDLFSLGDKNCLDVARAVLMAVLPTLKRYDQIDDHLEPDDGGDWVRYADLQAILNDGEGE